MKQSQNFYDSKFMNVCQKFITLIAIQLLWLLCCLPVVTIGASTKAMYASLWHFRREDAFRASVFFQAFRKDFLRVTGIWCGMLLAAAALAADYWIVANLEFSGKMAVIILIFFAALLWLLYYHMVFPMLSQFSMTVKDAIINGVLLSLARLPSMLLVTLASLFPLLLLIISLRFFIFLGAIWLSCGFSLIALYHTIILERIFAPFREDSFSC